MADVGTTGNPRRPPQSCVTLAAVLSLISCHLCIDRCPAQSAETSSPRASLGAPAAGVIPVKLEVTPPEPSTWLIDPKWAAALTAGDNGGVAAPSMAPASLPAGRPTTLTETAHAAAPEPAKADNVTFKLRGRIEADAIWVNQSEKNKLLFGNAQNAVGFRRARLGVEGTAFEQTRWVAEFDFADGNVALKDAFLAVNHLPIIREIRVGHIAEPFSLEGMTRSVWFPFVERSPGFTLDPTRNWGVAFFSHTDGQRLFFQGGAFRSGTDTTGTDIGDGNDMAYTARLVGLPWFDDSGDSLRLFHLGGAFSQRSAKDDTVTFNQSPQSSLLQSATDNPLTPFVPTIRIPATQNQLYNVQTALVLDSLSFEAEWNATTVDQIGGGPVFLHGGYVFGSYFLSGEHRNYNREFGTFREPTVRSPFACRSGCGGLVKGPGAWELTARLAYLDFHSSNLELGPDRLPVGNRLTTLTLGVNWYLNDNARLMFDYVHAVPVNPTFGSSAADTFTFRSAIFW